METRTPDEKRKLIDKLCDECPIEVGDDGRRHCLKCTFDKDPQSWCRVGIVSTIKDEDLDEILQLMQSVEGIDG